MKDNNEEPKMCMTSEPTPEQIASATESWKGVDTDKFLDESRRPAQLRSQREAILEKLAEMEHYATRGLWRERRETIAEIRKFVEGMDE